MTSTRESDRSPTAAVSRVSCGSSDQVVSDSIAGLVGGGGLRRPRLGRSRIFSQDSPRCPRTLSCTKAPAPACIRVPFRRYTGREVGGGRATRQPGQIRKEAALTSSGSGRLSASHLIPDGVSAERASMNDATPYRVLARKYRPATFDDLIGQDAMVRTLSNAFEAGRIPQAWILTGVRGVGKTTTARIL